LLQNGGEPDLEQIGNVFKDPEYGFKEKNNSEGIASISEAMFNCNTM